MQPNYDFLRVSITRTAERGQRHKQFHHKPFACALIFMISRPHTYRYYTATDAAAHEEEEHDAHRITGILCLPHSLHCHAIPVFTACFYGHVPNKIVTDPEAETFPIRMPVPSTINAHL